MRSAPYRIDDRQPAPDDSPGCGSCSGSADRSAYSPVPDSMSALESACEAARLHLQTVINRNRLDPDETELDDAIARWEEAKRALHETAG